MYDINILLKVLINIISCVDLDDHFMRRSRWGPDPPTKFIFL